MNLTNEQIEAMIRTVSGGDSNKESLIRFGMALPRMVTLGAATEVESDKAPRQPRRAARRNGNYTDWAAIERASPGGQIDWTKQIKECSQCNKSKPVMPAKGGFGIRITPQGERPQPYCSACRGQLDYRPRKG